MRTIKGKVLDAKGNPVSGARVEAHNFGNVSTTTGPDGTFQLAMVPHGELTLRIDAEDHPLAYEQVPADVNEVKIVVKDAE